MDGGVVVEQGPPAQVIDHPQHDRTRAFLRRMRLEDDESAAAAADEDEGRPSE